MLARAPGEVAHANVVQVRRSPPAAGFTPPGLGQRASVPSYAGSERARRAAHRGRVTRRPAPMSEVLWVGCPKPCAPTVDTICVDGQTCLLVPHVCLRPPPTLSGSLRFRSAPLRGATCEKVNLLVGGRTGAGAGVHGRAASAGAPAAGCEGAQIRPICMPPLVKVGADVSRAESAIDAVQATSRASCVSRSVTINARAAVAARTACRLGSRPGLVRRHPAGSSIRPFPAELGVPEEALVLLDAGAASAQRDCPAESSFLRGFVILSGSEGAAQA